MRQNYFSLQTPNIGIELFLLGQLNTITQGGFYGREN